MRREPAGFASSAKDTMARHDEDEGITAERLANSASRPRITETRGDLPV